MSLNVQDGEDPDSALKQAKTNSPYMMASGDDLLHIQQIQIVVEKVILCSVNTFNKALVCLFATYYVFDMAYPRECKNSVLFLEKALLKLTNAEKMSSSALAAVSTMDKL